MDLQTLFKLFSKWLNGEFITFNDMTVFREHLIIFNPNFTDPRTDQHDTVETRNNREKRVKNG
jgi:hypothetical protein